ncbi:MAG TPA: trypsin-like peptidase domain-containing protein [Mycobacteriales bacterium]|nr:trypsin-like peptidase domain-containing protein [Mycobacteriales bacterium]
MSDDRHWSDPRWADPDTRAHVDQPMPSYDDNVWAAPAQPPPTASSRWHPLLAGLIGLVVGAAVAVPFGLAHRPAVQSDAIQNPVSPPGVNNAPSADDIATQVDRSIVDITSRLGYQRAVAAGTGMVITAGGDVLTNNHVIDGATSITATSVTTGLSYTATVVGTDPTQDVAVIHLTKAPPLVPIDVGDSSSLTIGQAVVALGNAGGAGGTPAIASGYITDLDRQITATDAGGGNSQKLFGLIETDAPIRPGDSGGPLANSRAQVIGMDTAASAGSAYGNVNSRGFAIPIKHALDIAHQIEAGKASSTVHIGPRGMIGVSVADVSATPGAGAQVQSVSSGSPAAKAGIHAGDTIIAIDGSPVRTTDDLGTLIKKHGAGEKVTVTWITGAGVRHTASVTLIAGPPD